MEKYDFIIVGAGLFGCTCARLLTDSGFKCLVIEKNDYVGGLCNTSVINDVVIHNTSAHIFRTDDKNVWDFVNKYDEFIYPATMSISCMNNNKLYHFPFDLSTMSLTNNIYTPKNCLKQIKEDTKIYSSQNCSNLEEKCISEYGFEIYNKCIKGYTEKVYGRECKLLSPFLYEKYPMNYGYLSRISTQKYIGVPRNGYTKLCENILGDDIDIILKKEFINDYENISKLGKYIIYSGPIDKFCKYIYGVLDWCTLKFSIKKENLEGISKYGSSLIYFNDKDNLLVSITENQLLQDNFNNDFTYITYGYEDTWNINKECMFCINNDQTEEILDKYIEFTKENFSNMIFGGRCGLYRNLSMDETIGIAFEICNSIIKQLK